MSEFTFFDLLGERAGFLAVAFGHDGYFDNGGTYKFQQWTERRYRWPDGATALRSDATKIVAADERVDIYVCPAVRYTDDRRKGSALPPTLLWADLDGPAADQALLDALEPVVVHSGSEGHQHIYVRLSEPIDLGTHARLNKALADHLGADAKWSDETLLRLPGSMNHKSDPPAPVYTTSGSGRVWDPKEVASLLEVHLDGDPDVHRDADPSDPRGDNLVVDAEPVDLEQLPDIVRVRLADTHPEDRSAAFHGLVGACRDAGYSQGETVAVAAGWPPGVAKYGDRLATEVARCWPRVAPLGLTGKPEPTHTEQTHEPHRGQLRMAYRLGVAYEGRLLHVHGIGWFYFDGRRWAEDDQGEAKRAVLDVLRRALVESIGDKDLRKDVAKCESATGVNGVLDIASALEPFAATVRDLDPDPYLLNTPAGTLDLRTFELRSHDPADRITKLTRGAYVDSNGSPWHSFLERVLPDAEVRGFVQRLVGIGLLGVVREHVLPILTGPGRNGKGVFYGAIGHALGDYATVAEPDLFMHREGAHPTGEMDLRGVRWCVVSENDKGRRLAEATLKRLTGGDPIKARRMRKDFVTFDPSHTALLVTNHLPVVSGDDPAVWARLRVIPFDVVIPPGERDPELGERLQLEADAILAWAVSGYRDYLERGGLDEPETVTVATDRYQTDSDAVRRFIEECCIVNPHMWVTTGEAFARWCAWSTSDGAEQMSRKAFGQALDRLGFRTVKSTGGRRLRYGIGLAAEEEDDE